jgi:outer membrane biosynthesis protein TonB
MSTAAARAPQPLIDGRPPAGRRIAVRRRLAVPLSVTVLRSGVPDAVPGRSVDVCEGGVGAILAAELFPGELVGVEFQLPQAGAVLAKARVCYQERLRCGLQFLAISAEQKAMIDFWAQERQRPATTSAVEPPALDQHSQTKGKAALVDAPPALPSLRTYSASAARRESSTPRYLRRKVLMLLIASVMAAMGMGWWRWEQGWRELEAKLPARAAATQAPVNVPGEVMQRLLIHRVDPAAPGGPRSTHLTGRVVLDAVIGTDGSVLSLHPISGPDPLIRAAIESVQWWKFQPYRVNGEAVEVETTIAVNFL